MRKKLKEEKKKKTKVNKKIIHSKKDAEAYNFATDFVGSDIGINEIED